VLWLCKRKPHHRPLYERWSGLFKHGPGSTQWHRTAHWVYGQGHRAGYYYAKGLGLDDRDRQPMRTMLSARMRADRETLRRLPDLRERIWLHATRRPDRAGKVTASEIADRRTEMLRLFLLSDRNRALAATYYGLLYGKAISRQALSRQLEAVEEATGLKSLKSRYS
jgi:hypothetical protein